MSQTIKNLIATGKYAMRITAKYTPEAYSIHEGTGRDLMMQAFGVIVSNGNRKYRTTYRTYELEPDTAPVPTLEQVLGGMINRAATYEQVSEDVLRGADEDDVDKTRVARYKDAARQLRYLLGVEVYQETVKIAA